MNSLYYKLKVLAFTEGISKMKWFVISTDIATPSIIKEICDHTEARIQRSITPIKRFIITKQKEL